MVPDTRKVVILARGLGSRMRAGARAGNDLTAEQKAVADAGMKAMIPIGRPFLDHCLSAYADAGFTEACLVIGPEHDSVRAYYDSLRTQRLRVTTVIQERPLGTADALLAAEGFASGERIVMVNGDNYYPTDVMRTIRRARGHVAAGFDARSLVERGNIPGDRVRAFALLLVDGVGRLVDILEKPSVEEYHAWAGRSRVSMNCFGFDADVFDAARTVQPSTRGELEIVDAVRAIITSGGTVTVEPVAAGVLDMSSRDDVPAVAERLQREEVFL